MVQSLCLRCDAGSVAVHRSRVSQRYAELRARRDFERARPLFADDVVAFGTYAAVISGRDHLEQEQWRNVWPEIRDFTFRLDELRCLGQADTICAVVTWDSLRTRARES